MREDLARSFEHASLSLLLKIVAVASLGLVFLRVTNGLGFDFDPFVYHFPFAARLVGICDTDCYQVAADLESRFYSFPRLPHLLQGLIWKLTGDLRYIDAISFFCFLFFIGYLKRVFGVSAALATVALLAVPMVQIAVSTAYIDLPVAVLISIALLSIVDLYLRPDSFGPAKLVLFCSSLVIVSNAKLQSWPLVAVAGLGFLALFIRHRNLGVGGLSVGSVAGRRLIVLLFLLVFLLVGFTALRNTAIYGNPFFPLQVNLLGLELPGISRPTSSISAAHFHTNHFLRWLASVFEYRAYDERYIPWTMGQGEVRLDSRSFRMGGFFGLYVMVNLLVFVKFSGRLEAVNRRAFRGFFLLLTLVFAALPSSYYLRYYLFWMVMLVALNLILLGHRRQRTGHAVCWAQAYRYLVLFSFSAVVLLTGGTYLKPAPYASVEQLVHHRKIDDAIEKKVADGDTVCIRGFRPLTFFFSSLFHQPRVYKVLEVHPEAEIPSGCDVVLQREVEGAAG